MNTAPDDPLTVAFAQAMRTHLFHKAARDLLASDPPATAELLGLPAQVASAAVDVLDPVEEADLLFQVGRSRLVHAQFMDGDPAAVLGKLLVVQGKVLLDNRSHRLEQYLVVLERRHLPDAESLERTGLDLTVVPLFDVPLDRLLSRPVWAPFAVLPRTRGPHHAVAVGLAERAITGAKRPDEERLLDAVRALRELP